MFGKFVFESPSASEDDLHFAADATFRVSTLLKLTFNVVSLTGRHSKDIVDKIYLPTFVR